MILPGLYKFDSKTMANVISFFWWLSVFVQRNRRIEAKRKWRKTAGFAVTEDVKFQDNSKVDLCYIFYGFMLRIGVECRHICDKLRMQAKKKLNRVRGSLTFYSKYDKNSYHIHRIVSEIERISSFHWNTRNTKVFSQNIWNILKMLKIITAKNLA